MASELRQKITDDMHAAMKARDAARLSTLKMLLSAIGYVEMEKQKDLSDDDVLAVISKEVKQHRESVLAYKEGNRPDLQEKEQKELDILLEYLPAQLSTEEIEAIVVKAIAELGVSGPSNKGKVMGKIMPLTKGKADGREVNAIVDRLLNA